MKKLIFILTALWLSAVPAAAAVVHPAAGPDGVVVLTYHDVGKVTDLWAVTPATLEAHLDYIAENGYTPISLDQYIAAAKGEAKLPAKALLLSFDDGYESFYTTVFPILKQRRIPAVMAIITSWLETAPPAGVKAVTWPQLREMENSGLVSVVSHTHQLHRYVSRNPQGDAGTAVETRIYQNGRYETLPEYRQRLQADFAHTQALFEQHMGHKSKALVWPFGAYTHEAIELAKAEGFTVCFKLQGGLNSSGKAALDEALRGIITGNPGKKQFGRYLQTHAKDSPPLRAAQIDIDPIYDEDPRQLALNIKLAIERLQQAGANTVFLQAFSDNGSGNIDSVYFATEAAPVKAAVFDHIAAKMQEQGFSVFAWVPTLSGQWLSERYPAARVAACDSNAAGWYNRASPFSEEVAASLESLFSDLAAYSHINGILFQDDLYLNDYEDFSPAAQAAFQREFNRPLTPEALTDDQLRPRWTALKTRALDDLTGRLLAASRRYRPQLVSARNIYALSVANPASEEWFAQNYQNYLRLYDFTVIMAYPYLEKQNRQAGSWLAALADAALREPEAARKTVFKLQTYDWTDGRWLETREVRRWENILRRKGVQHFAYYPENVYAFE
ncbi:MAG: poly-beta-1,6-N-acetyl-D-glucosamine N-deacetylase PgaB [Sporomusaceae bacterium]|nr:poly-beta-1,6-N-acetyl-D-glucosamine N-deacetylase PgaB [Sporomusaceae bacterium]